MLDNLDLNLLKVFVAIYRHQSITIAADELGLTQPGVSGLIKRLQQKTGCQLFVRSGRGIMPTQNAHEFFKQVEPALIQINNALENLEGFDITSPRKFVVYASEPLMLQLLPKIEADKELGQVTIELQPTYSSEEELIQALSHYQGHLALEFTSYKSSAFFAEELFDDSVCIIARKGHPRLNSSVSLEQFYAEKHITLKLRREDIYLADYFTEETLNERQVAAECTSLVSQMSMVANSDCIATVSSSLANMFSEKFGLAVFSPPFKMLPVRYRVMAHKRERNSSANMWLRDKIRSYFDGY